MKESASQSASQNLEWKKTFDLVLEYCEQPKTAKEICGFLNIASKSYVSANIVKPLIDKKYLDYTNKKSVNARNQKYITLKKRE